MPPKQPAERKTTSRKPALQVPGRLAVRKTYKLYLGGAFPRSESGRSYPVRSADGALLAHAALASRKDARDAVVAARGAVARWSGATAYNRGQVLYRIAEMIEGRAAQFAEVVAEGEGMAADAAADIVAAAIDRWVWYAGWPDKVAQVAGAANPVAGPYFNFSVPEPTGVVAVVAPAGSSLLGLVSVIAPVIATGNTAVVVASEERPLAAITLAEVLATSDLPGGVVNLLTGRTAELAPVLAGHFDVNAIDLTGVPGWPARGTGAPGGRERQAGLRRRQGPGRRRLGGAAGTGPAARVPGNEDRLAPGRHLAEPEAAAQPLSREAGRRRGFDRPARSLPPLVVYGAHQHHDPGADSHRRRDPEDRNQSADNRSPEGRDRDRDQYDQDSGIRGGLDCSGNGMHSMLPTGFRRPGLRASAIRRLPSWHDGDVAFRHQAGKLIFSAGTCYQRAGLWATSTVDVRSIGRALCLQPDRRLPSVPGLRCAR